MTKTIIITGGHHNSALVIANYLVARGHRVLWIGHKFTSSSDKSLSAEFMEISKSGIPFLELKTGKFYRKYNPFEYLKIAFGFMQSLIYLKTNKPDLIISFGGYLAVPVVITGWLLGIPAITHEQTVTAGWANKAISHFVKEILLTHPSSKKNYPAGKSHVVGLPIRPELLDKSLKKKFTPPLIYIICGKQGSHIINQALFPLIPQLVQKFTVVHQTGSHSVYKDYDKARRVKDSLGEFKNRYVHAPYFYAKESAVFMQSAQIIVSRSGAHLAYEISLLRKNSVFIPISWASHNEQYLNAKLAKNFTSAVIINEDQLTSQSLLDAINKALKLPPKKKPVKTLPTDATKEIISAIGKYL